MNVVILLFDHQRLPKHQVALYPTFPAAGRAYWQRPQFIVWYTVKLSFNVFFFDSKFNLLGHRILYRAPKVCIVPEKPTQGHIIMYRVPEPCTGTQKPVEGHRYPVQGHRVLYRAPETYTGPQKPVRGHRIL